MGERTAALGMLCEVLGALVAALLALAQAPAWLPAPLFLIGLGQGIALPALVRLNVDQVDPRWAGLAAGLVSATLQISAAVATALVGGLFFTLAPDDDGARLAQVGFAFATLAIGAALLLAAALSWRQARIHG
jgi:MFS family permease